MLYKSKNFLHFFLFFFVFYKKQQRFISKVNLRRMRNPSLNTNLIKTKENKNKPISIYFLKIIKKAFNHF